MQISVSLSVIILFLFCFNNMKSGLADIGTASSYDPPYTPTRCYGNQRDQFPAGNFFASVSEGIWDNGAACGRIYRLNCLSGVNKPCTKNSIDVVVLDLDVCSGRQCPTFLLSNDAFSAISTSPTTPTVKLNVEYNVI